MNFDHIPPEIAINDPALPESVRMAAKAYLENKAKAEQKEKETKWEERYEK